MCLDTLGSLSEVLRLNDPDGNVSPVLYPEGTSSVESSVRRLVEFTQNLPPRLQEQTVRAKAEKVLRKALLNQQKRAKLVNTHGRKLGAASIDSTEDLGIS
jgi:hypothetical protein